MKKYIVTGGAGFIGSHLTDALVKSGGEIHVVDTIVGGDMSRLNKNAHHHKVDIRSSKELVPIFDGALAVFHLATLPSVPYSIDHPEETFDVNVRGTQAVLEAMSATHVPKIIFSSSSAVYGDKDIFPIEENATLEPKSPYALHKKMSEDLLRLYGTLYDISSVSLRYFNVYGPRQKATDAYASVIPRFVDKKKKGEKLTIVGDGTQTRDFVHVSDVVNANLKALNLDRQGSIEINIGSGVETSVLNIASLIGGDKEFIAPRIEPKRSCADISRALKILRFEPQVGLEAGILNLIKG